MFGKTVGQRRKAVSTLASHKLTRPGPPRPQGPFLRAKIIKSYVYLSVFPWYSTPQVSFALFTVLNSSFFCQLFHPSNIHSVSNSCNISVGHVFWQVFDIFSSNSKDIFLIYYQMYWINSGVYNFDFKPFLP